MKRKGVVVDGASKAGPHRAQVLGQTGCLARWRKRREYPAQKQADELPADGVADDLLANLLAEIPSQAEWVGEEGRAWRLCQGSFRFGPRQCELCCAQCRRHVKARADVGAAAAAATAAANRGRRAAAMAGQAR